MLSVHQAHYKGPYKYYSYLVLVTQYNNYYACCIPCLPIGVCDLTLYVLEDELWFESPSSSEVAATEGNATFLGETGGVG